MRRHLNWRRLGCERPRNGQITNTSTVISRAISFDPRLFPAWEINVEWNPRLKTSYGRGGPTHYGIKLHPAIQTYPDQLRRTFLHELAHCMEYLFTEHAGMDKAFGRQ
jgi:predicted SprT family Zn-dependent metalloprotease